MSYSVRLLPRAKTDLHRIFFYIEERSPEGALRWEKALEAGLDRLGGNPLIYGLAPEDSHFDFELRQLLFKTKHGRTPRMHGPSLTTYDGARRTLTRIGHT